MNDVLCPCCGTKLKEETRFCNNCGFEIKYCKNCGTPLKNNEKFCSQCGERQIKKEEEILAELEEVSKHISFSLPLSLEDFYYLNKMSVLLDEIKNPSKAFNKIRELNRIKEYYSNIEDRVLSLYWDILTRKSENSFKETDFTQTINNLEEQGQYFKKSHRDKISKSTQMIMEGLFTNEKSKTEVLYFDVDESSDLVQSVEELKLSGALGEDTDRVIEIINQVPKVSDEFETSNEDSNVFENLEVDVNSISSDEESSIIERIETETIDELATKEDSIYVTCNQSEDDEEVNLPDQSRVIIDDEISNNRDESINVEKGGNGAYLEDDNNTKNKYKHKEIQENEDKITNSIDNFTGILIDDSSEENIYIDQDKIQLDSKFKFKKNKIRTITEKEANKEIDLFKKSKKSKKPKKVKKKKNKLSLEIKEEYKTENPYYFDTPVSDVDEEYNRELDKSLFIKAGLLIGGTVLVLVLVWTL